VAAALYETLTKAVQGGDANRAGCRRTLVESFRARSTRAWAPAAARFHFERGDLENKARNCNGSRSARRLTR
jgi:hypothetical protein